MTYRHRHTHTHMKHLTYGKCLQMTKKAKIYCKNDDDDPFGFLMNNCREYFVVCELNFIYYFQNVFSLNFFLLLLLCCIILLFSHHISSYYYYYYQDRASGRLANLPAI